jgi:acetyl-CoA carboxylase biotin carboxyl carrier protein
MNGSKAKKKPAAVGSGFTIPGVDLVQVERVLDFMASHHLEEFEYSHGGLHIRLKRAVAGRAPAPLYIPAEIPADGPPSNSSAAQPAATAAGEAPAAAPVSAAPKEELHIIKSPIVGTFYAAPSPEAPPFVKVGDVIQAGQVVCIVEALKLMNEIEADMGGEVVGVLAENGQPVEYGQSLFALRPAKKKK